MKNLIKNLLFTSCIIFIVSFQTERAQAAPPESVLTYSKSICDYYLYEIMKLRLEYKNCLCRAKKDSVIILECIEMIDIYHDFYEQARFSHCLLIPHLFDPVEPGMDPCK